MGGHRFGYLCCLLLLSAEWGGGNYTDCVSSVWEGNSGGWVHVDSYINSHDAYGTNGWNWLNAREVFFWILCRPKWLTSSGQLYNTLGILCSWYYDLMPMINEVCTNISWVQKNRNQFQGLWVISSWFLLGSRKDHRMGCHASKMSCCIDFGISEKHYCGLPRKCWLFLLWVLTSVKSTGGYMAVLWLLYSAWVAGLTYALSWVNSGPPNRMGQRVVQACVKDVIADFLCLLGWVNYWWFYKVIWHGKHSFRVCIYELFGLLLNYRSVVIMTGLYIYNRLMWSVHLVLGWSCGNPNLLGLFWTGLRLSLVSDWLTYILMGWACKGLMGQMVYFLKGHKFGPIAEPWISQTVRMYWDKLDCYVGITMDQKLLCKGGSYGYNCEFVHGQMLGLRGWYDYNIQVTCWGPWSTWSQACSTCVTCWVWMLGSLCAHDTDQGGWAANWCICTLVMGRAGGHLWGFCVQAIEAVAITNCTPGLVLGDGAWDATKWKRDVSCLEGLLDWVSGPWGLYLGLGQLEPTMESIICWTNWPIACFDGSLGRLGKGMPDAVIDGRQLIWACMDNPIWVACDWACGPDWVKYFIGAAWHRSSKNRDGAVIFYPGNVLWITR
ncbi:hypothetical protein R6Q59_035796 [Mikania micrantha]